MNLYPENYDVTVSVAFTDLNGAPVTPSAVRAVLYDGADELVVDFGSLPFDVSEGRKDIVIPAAFNVLGDGETTAARILRVALVTAAGEIRRSSSYLIEGEFRLVLMQNSFITIEAAEILARDMPNMFGWSGSDQETRCAALVNAYHRLTRIPMKFRTAETPLQYINEGFYSRPYHWTKDLLWNDGSIPELVIPAPAWSSIDAEEFMAFPADFRRKVRMAQVAEANDILENDVTNRRHRQGIISETVGESSIMLRGGRLNLGISSAALEYLSGHVHYQFKVSRG
jgi:hypothetical protein